MEPNPPQPPVPEATPAFTPVSTPPLMPDSSPPGLEWPPPSALAQAASPAGAQQQPTQPWYVRTPVLLGIGAVVLLAALAFAFIGDDSDSTSTRKAGSTTGGSNANGSTTSVEPSPKVVLTDVKAFEPEWIFRDPNRAIGDDSSSIVTATWLLDDRVIVLSADIIRAHSLDDGSVLWEQPLKLEPCAAVSQLPADSNIVVIGEAEPDSLCESLRAIDVSTGKTVWSHAEASGFTSNTFEKVVAAPAGLFVLDNNGVEVLDPKTGNVRISHERHPLGEQALGTSKGKPFFAADAAALDEKAGVLIATGAVLRVGVDSGEPTFAIGFDAESGKVLWTSEIAPERVPAIPQTDDPRFILLGSGPDEVVMLDLKTAKVKSRYPVAEQTEKGRPNYEQFAHLGAPWYRTGTVPVDDDLVVIYEQVTADREAYDDNLVRIDGVTGKEVWRVGAPDLPEVTKGLTGSLVITAGPLVDDTHLMATLSDREKAWIAVIDVATGKVVSLVAQPDEITNSNIQGDPALHLLDGGRLLMIYNPNGGYNSIEDPTESGEDQTSVILLRPAS